MASPRPKPLISRGEVYYVRLDPTQGSEIRKTRPCVVVSPDELNHHLRTVIVAPMTTASRPYPWRIQCRFRGRDGVVALDQLRAVDTARLGPRRGELSFEALERSLVVLQEMFAP
jgi:mRNA interferase MazF